MSHHKDNKERNSEHAKMHTHMNSHARAYMHSRTHTHTHTHTHTSTYMDDRKPLLLMIPQCRREDLGDEQLLELLIDLLGGGHRADRKKERQGAGQRKKEEEKTWKIVGMQPTQQTHSAPCWSDSLVDPK